MTDAQLDAKIDGLSVAGNDGSPVRDLLKKVLRVRPQDRMQGMDSILNHGFFTGGLKVR